LLLDLTELCRKEIQLIIRHSRPFAIFAGNEPRILQRITEQPDNLHKRRIQREIDARLGHRRSVQGTRLLRDRWHGRAQVPRKNI
jgi:hypothetical protein